MVSSVLERTPSSSSSSSRRWCCGSVQDQSPRSGEAMTQGSGLFKNHLKETLQKSTSDSDKRRDMQKLVWQQQAGSDAPEAEHHEEVEMLNSIQAKEQEIEKRKAEVHQKVQAKLTKVELEARNLDNLRKELENLEDPTRKEVGEIRKKIEAVERELKPLKQLVDKKEKELKEASKAHEERIKQKNALVNKLMEVVAESEALRMKKLNELSKSFEDLELGSPNTTVSTGA